MIFEHHCLICLISDAHNEDYRAVLSIGVYDRKINLAWFQPSNAATIGFRR